MFYFSFLLKFQKGKVNILIEKEIGKGGVFLLGKGKRFA